MIASLRLAQLAASVYDDATPARWQCGDVKVSLTEEGGVPVLALRGTSIRNPADLERDADCRLLNDPVLGPCHRGFALGARSVFEQIKAELPPGCDFALTGHSLGAALAQCLAGLFADAKRPPCQLEVFEPPRTGALRGLVAGLPGRAWRNGDDLVTELPFWLPHPQPMTALGSASLADMLDPLRDHYIAGVIAALTALPAARAVIGTTGRGRRSL